MVRRALVTIALSVCSCTLLAQHAPSDTDATAIKGMIDRMDEQGWNQHDMKVYTADMTDDAQWINVVGMLWKGKADIYRALDVYHHTIFKSRQLQAPTDVEMREVAPGAVVATYISTADPYTMSTGTQVPLTRNRLTLVLVKQSGRWMITEGHNTVIDEAALKRDPAAH